MLRADWLDGVLLVDVASVVRGGGIELGNSKYGYPFLSTVTSEVTVTKTPMVRWGVYDCFSDETCGTDNHTGSLSKSTYETALSGIVNTLHAVPWLKMVPVTRGAIGSVSNGSVFCPPSTNWGMNLPAHVVSHHARPEGVRLQPRLQVVTVGYIGVNGGTNWGQSCTANSNYPYGYNCTTPTRWIDEFNNQVLSNYNAATINESYYVPDVESVHSYCHSTDFASNPFTFDNNICYAFQREQLASFRTQVNNIWGTTGASPCTISEDASTPPVANTGENYGAASVTSASFSPPAGGTAGGQRQHAAGQPARRHVGHLQRLQRRQLHGRAARGGLGHPGGLFFAQTYLPSAPGPMTVTATQSGGHAGSMQLEVRVLDDASQVQTSAASGASI
jgi:hypothetical protein